MSSYRMRAEQIADFRRELYADCREAGYPLPAKAWRLIAKALQDAAMVGACEARSYAMQFMRASDQQACCNRSVLAVLGYEDSNRSTRKASR